MGGGGSSGPTAQQQALQTEQALTNANLNLEENEQRKTILNALEGTRVFRGSALSRAVAGNTQGSANPNGAPSFAQQLASPSISANGESLLDPVNLRGATARAAAGGTPVRGGK